MKMIWKLIKLHKTFFGAAFLFTFLSVISNLYWNKFLAQLLDSLENTSLSFLENEMGIFFAIGIFIVFIHAICEYLSLYFHSNNQKYLLTHFALRTALLQH